uniref:30S ribosomal protein S7 n=1 Tax=Jaagichlorella roystonensis TaxID=1052852 RepID=A0A6C0M8W7_9CHLO|nr:30S ribosomal protein S7 [Jaagichlorella roystonensis]YP_009733051.1 30S ribosomal protein S7 [Jaagichlorella roystonensis]QHU78303.1 30S ribosomal protein S7 [Jaagichlorella roystonensis]QHU78347.1 30S ribosomal protein S7 [Jaagichlorella roystonensis]
MNKIKVKNRNLISRFSSSLLGRGKKAEGHKIFFNLLLFLRVNTERELLNLNLQQDLLKDTISNTSFVYFLRSIGFHKNNLQKFFPKNEKAFHVIAKDYSKVILPSQDYSENNSQVFSMSSRNPKPNQLQQQSSKETKNTIKQQRMQEENHSYVLSTQAFSSKLLCKMAINNVKPVLETRKVRKGRMTYRIPLVTRTERQEGKAISWLVAGASSRRNKVKNGQSVSFLGTSVPLSLAKPVVNSNTVSTVIEQSHSVKAKQSPLSSVKATLPTVSKNEKPISLNRKQVKEVLSLIENKRKHYRSLQYCLAESFLEAFQGKGESVEKRKEFHQLALQNRAYTHYRWW